MKYGKTLDEEVTANWALAHAYYQMGDLEGALAVYRQNRRDHGVELFYEIPPPDPVRFIHPIGAVLGRANYSPHLVVYQCSGVGSDLDGNRPTFKGPCVLFPGARVLGNANIGSNVFVTANTVIQNLTIPDNCVVWQSPFRRGADGFDDLRSGVLCRPTKRSVIESFFNVP